MTGIALDDFLVRGSLFHAVDRLSAAEGPRSRSEANTTSSIVALTAQSAARRLVRTPAVAGRGTDLRRALRQHRELRLHPTSSSFRPPTAPKSWSTYGYPKATSFAETEREAKRLEQQLSKDPDLAYVTTFIGEGAPRFYLPLDQQLRNQNFAQLLLMSKSIEARERVLVAAREILAHDFPNVRFKADRLFNGPPVGWPVQVRVTGPDRNEVRRLAEEVGDVMRANPTIGNVHNDWLEPVPSLKLEIDQDRARALGVSSQSVRRSLQAMLSGFQIGEFREQDETIKVMLREPSSTRNLLSASGQRLREDGCWRIGAAAPGGQCAVDARARHPMAQRPAAVHYRSRRGAR